MTTERALPTPPLTSPTFSFPSPLRRDPALKPNPHPYAVKTTTTGVLSRSSSSGQNVDATHHYYIPTSPNASRSPESARGHKASKSFASLQESPTRSSPRPLPVPPGISHFPRSGSSATSHSNGRGSVSADEGHVSHRRTSRAETMPSYSTSGVIHHSMATFEDLRSNPKLWTPSQLSTYLMTALRAADVGDFGHIPLPVPVALDIATFMKEEMVNGRMFLRMNEDDLERMGINTKWRGILLTASQNLRQNVLKGRIWGPETALSPSDSATSPPLPMHVFSSALYNSSSSSVDLSADESNVDMKAPRPRRHRNGRVRGMVETFERSGSFSSGSSIDGEEGDERTGVSRWLRDERPMNAEPLRSPSPTDRAPMLETVPRGHRVEQEEPTIQALLAASEVADSHSTGSWGARAWEQMDMAPGITVKRIVHSEVGVLVEAPPPEALTTVVGRGGGSGEGNRSRLRKNREERRVVTAIFSPTEAAAAEPLGEKQVAEHPATRTGLYDECAQTDGADSYVQGQRQSDEIEALQRQLAATRALVEAFRQRLEVVEQKVADFEAKQGKKPANSGPDAGWSGPLSTNAESQTDAISDEIDDDGDVTLVREDANGHGSLLDRTTAFIPAALQQMRVNGDIIPFARPWTARPSPGDGDEPSSVSDLPSYVLLVGIGVCAVVLRVVLRRVSGRGAMPPWKP